MTQITNKLQPPTNPLVLAIDPGYDRVGWAVGVKNKRKPQLVDLGLIQTSKTDNIFLRYQQIAKELRAITEKFQPKEVAIEKLYFAKNVKTAIKVAEARGVIINLLLKAGLPIFEYDPTQIKQTVTGNGHADKKAVAKMLKLQLGADENLNDDALDAAACYLTHVIVNNDVK